MRAPSSVQLAVLAAGFMLVAGGFNPGRAQVTTATFYGVLSDSTGARIPAASVTMLNEGTGAVTKKTADSTGEFAFDFLPIGSYTLRIEASGFKAQERKNFEFSAGQQIRQSFTLELGSVTETVNVAGAAQLIDTVSAEQHQTFDSRAISELPLSRRNISNILGLQAGVDVASGSRGVRINGAGKSGAGISVDGTDANSNPEGRGISQYGGENYIDVMSIEGVEEVQVVRGILPAEYGGVLSGQVNLISKSGSNTWHGSFFEAYQSHVFQARNPFTPNRNPDGSFLPKPRIVFNQFGASAGGRIIRDKLFVFGTYEGYREPSSVSVNGNVPTDSFRAEILKALPFPETKLLLDLMPRPTEIRNVDQGRWVGIRTRNRSDNNFVIKGDWHITQAGNLSMTFTRDRPYYLSPSFYVNGANDRTFEYKQDRVTASYIAGSAAWTSETRFGANISDMSRQDAFFEVKDPGNSTEKGPWGRRIGQITLAGTSGFSTPSSELWGLDGPSYSVDQKLAHHIGKHSLKFGGKYLFTGGSRVNPQNPSFSYNTKEDLLANIPASINASFGAAPHRSRIFEMGFFTQDDWRVTSKLVINLGLRYDFYGHAIVEGSTDSKVGIYNLTPPKDWNKFDFGPFSSPEHPYNNDGWVNLGPRVGFAYSFGGTKNVIRGGIGVLYSSNIPAVVRQGAADPVVPFRSIWSKQEAAALGFKWPLYADQFRAVVQDQAAKTGQIFIFSVLNPGLQSPYSIQAQLNFQRQITNTLMIETGYVGTRGVKLPLQRRFNEADRLTGIRPNPGLGAPGGYYVDNTQNSAYHAWQTSFRQRLLHNLTFEAHYTFSKSLAVTGGDIGAYFQGDSNAVEQEFSNPRADRGPAAGDTRHRLVGDWVYEVPYSDRFGNKIVRSLLGGWEVNGVLNIRSGDAIDITETCASSRYCRPDYAGGPTVLDNWQHTFDLNACNLGINCGLKYLNPAAFVAVPVSSVSGIAIRPGNLGYAAIRGPGSWTTNAGLGRNINFGERYKLRLRADMFNALNHVNYGNPTASINSSTFGQIRSAGGMRSMQMNARLTW